eukprot:764672-Hanusia_phi.AAC.1
MSCCRIEILATGGSQTCQQLALPLLFSRTNFSSSLLIIYTRFFSLQVPHFLCPLLSRPCPRPLAANQPEAASKHNGGLHLRTRTIPINRRGGCSISITGSLTQAWGGGLWFDPFSTTARPASGAGMPPARPGGVKFSAAGPAPGLLTEGLKAFLMLSIAVPLCFSLVAETFNDSQTEQMTRTETGFDSFRTVSEA